MKFCNVPYSGMSSSTQCRLDSKYAIFVYNKQSKAFDSNNNTIKLKDILIPLPIKKVKKGELEEEYTIINISEQVANSGQLENLYKVIEVASDKNILTESEIVVSKLGMSRGYIFLNPFLKENLIGSSEFIPYKFKNSEFKLFYLYLLLHEKMRKAYACLETGKTPSHKRVNPFEFLEIKIPNISEDMIRQHIADIKKYDDKIRDCKEKIITMHSIINDVFSNEFGFDKELYNEFGKGMTVGTQSANSKNLRISKIGLNHLGNNKLMRFSVRYHNSTIEKIMNVLATMDTLSVKSIVESDENVQKGVQPKYAEEGTPVVKITNMKNQKLSFEEVEYADQTFCDSLDKSKILKKNDIIICCTGKGSLGKIDIFEEDFDAITSVDNIIVRINEKQYNVKFFVYFFRSILGYSQMERDYTGTTNQIHLYWEQISEFKIPNISLDAQERIIKNIETKAIQQEKIRNEIKQCRQEIEKIITKLVEA